MNRFAQRDDSGATLVETSYAGLIFMVIVALVLMIVSTLSARSIASVAQGQAFEGAQSQIPSIDQYLKGAMTPDAACESYAASTHSPYSYACSDGTQTNLNACNGASNHSAVSVVRAYPYELELCASPAAPTACSVSDYSQARTSCPHLFEIYIDSTGPGPVPDNGGAYACSSAQDDACTLVIRDLSATGTPAVGTISNVRCDSTCQQHLGPDANLNPTGVDTPYLYNYQDRNATVLTGSTSSESSSTTLQASIQAVALDLEIMGQPVPAVASKRTWSEVTDSVFLTGAVEPVP